MSARTMDVLQTTIQALQNEADVLAIWIDAFCLPPRGDPSRTISIDKMGDIYCDASKVVVVLSKESERFLRLAKIGISGRPNIEHIRALEELENDLWATRAWTYQEITNSNDWIFVTEGNPKETAVNGLNLLNAIGNTKEAYRRESRLEDSTVRLRFPNVDLFEQVLEDCVLGRPRNRSALHTMSNVDQRIRERGEDYFNAMIGAVVNSSEASAIRMNWKIILESPGVQDLTNKFDLKDKAEGTIKDATVDSIVQPLKTAFAANQFMQACAAKGDYSFIYTTSQRSSVAGQSWRPVAGTLKAICPCNSWGTGQPGMLRNGQLELQKMLFLKAGALKEAARRYLTTWVQIYSHENIRPTSVETIKQYLAEVGFLPQCEDSVVLMLEDGYFFPQHSWNVKNEVQVFASSAIQWRFGAPAVLTSLHTRSGRESHRFVSVGIFVGDVVAVEKKGEKCSVVFEEAHED